MNQVQLGVNNYFEKYALFICSSDLSPCDRLIATLATFLFTVLSGGLFPIGMAIKYCCYHEIDPIPLSPLAAGDLLERRDIDERELMVRSIRTARVPHLSEEQEFDVLMEQAVHEILPGLFLGGSDYIPQKAYSFNGEAIALEQLDYDWIISATHWRAMDGYQVPSDKVLYSLPADPTRIPPDVTLNSLKQDGVLNNALDTIDHVRRRNQTVFVHCQQGKDRSATIVIAYIMRTYDVTFQEAMNFVRAKRFIAEPGDEYKEFLRGLDFKK